MRESNDARRGRRALFWATALGALGIGAAAPGGAQQAASSALEARMQRIEDEAEIRDLIIEYGTRLDTRDWAAFARLFAADGEWRGNIGGAFVTLKGREHIRAEMEKAFAGSPFDPANVGSVHLINNISIDVQGERATGTSRWTVLARGPDDAPVARMTGRYDDVFVREDGEWKIARRTAPRDIPSQDP